MIALLEIGPIQFRGCKDFNEFLFLVSCPIYTAEIEQDVPAAHGFLPR
ncbi:MAG: hypothetical protein M3Y50_12285 [Acidobacteriota bacterium]|nr:hypothetical protein [Acidobacteriota bacterium]